MKFVLLPVLDTMIGLYEEPAKPARFERYLTLMLNERRDDITLPIGAYNPMAKSHVLEQLQQLRSLEVEALMQRAITEANSSITDLNDQDVYEVAVVLADDLKGGWTNRYTNDYTSKFETEALLKRHFITPHFWSSETFDKQTILQRTREYLLRAQYQLHHAAAKTLEDHIAQEVFVTTSLSLPSPLEHLSQPAHAYYQRNQGLSDHSSIMAFLYGDSAAEQLGYPKVGDGHPGIFLA